jgi:hypothetical protein
LRGGGYEGFESEFVADEGLKAVKDVVEEGGCDCEEGKRERDLLLLAFSVYF